MTQFLTVQQCTPDFIRSQCIPFNEPGLTRRGLRSGLTTESSVEVLMNWGTRHRLTFPALKVAVKLLSQMGWGISYEQWGSLVAVRVNTLLNEAVMNNRHDIAIRYRRARKELLLSSSLWDSVKGIKAAPMDNRIMEGLVKFAESWPEVAKIAYNGTSFTDFDGTFFAEPGQIAIRFWPVVFRDAETFYTRGVSASITYYISTDGHISHNWNENDEYPHPHTFSDGAVCAGEAQFGQSQMKSLAELRNWYVSTDHSPASSEWSGTCHEWWNNNKEMFFRHYHGAGEGTAYVILAPMTSMSGYSNESDRNAEAETVVLTPTRLNELLMEYAAPPGRNNTECHECGTRFNDDDTYFCDYCDHDFCGRHFEGDYDMCSACFSERYVRCAGCDEMIESDHSTVCDVCFNRYCDSCIHNDDNGMDICTGCKDGGHGDWSEDEESTGDETPHDHVARIGNALRTAAPDGGPAWAPGWVRTIPGDDHCTWPYWRLGENCGTAVARFIGIGSRCYVHVPRGTERNPINGDVGIAIAQMTPTQLAAALPQVPAPVVPAPAVPFREFYIPMARAINPVTFEPWQCSWNHGAEEIPDAEYRRLGGGDYEFLCGPHYRSLPERGAAQFVAVQETPVLQPITIRAFTEPDYGRTEYTFSWEPAVFVGFMPDFAEMESPEFWPHGETNLAAYMGSYRWAGSIAWRDRSEAFREAVIENEYAIEDMLRWTPCTPGHYFCEGGQHCPTDATWKRTLWEPNGPNFVCDEHR